MIDLSTNYMGLNLKNPIIVSSSGLSNSAEKVARASQNGAGAVVLKSLFEEQILHEASDLIRHNDYPEAEDYIRTYATANSVETYLKIIEDSKKAVDIPVIASINCVSGDEWVDFAKRIEEAGADALELNIYIVTTDENIESKQYEIKYYKIIQEIKKRIKIPVAIKIGSYFSNLVYFVKQLKHNGADAVVLFNRFYEPDIDINEMKFTAAEVFSSPSDLQRSLRWVGIISSEVSDIDISASTGIHDGVAAIKQLLAGAETVQICSTLYKNGFGKINDILEFINYWMKQKGYESIRDFRGKMSYKKIPNSQIYERAQFMKYFASID